MPIEFTIDHARRLVTAIARGTLTGQEVFGYQRDAWSRPEVQGYNVATTDEAFGLSRMYETYRHLEGKGTRHVAVFPYPHGGVRLSRSTIAVESGLPSFGAGVSPRIPTTRS